MDIKADIQDKLYRDIKAPIDNMNVYKRKLSELYEGKKINLNAQLKNLIRETGISYFLNVNTILAYSEFLEFLEKEGEGDEMRKNSVLFFNKSQYRKLTSLNKNFKKIKNIEEKKVFVKTIFIKTKQRNITNDTLFHRNLELFFEIYLLALDFENYDLLKINENIADLLLVANIKFGNKFSNKKRMEAITWAIQNVFDGKKINFETLKTKYENSIPKYEKRKSYDGNKDISFKHILLVKYLLKDKRTSFKNALEDILDTKLSKLSETGIKQFMSFKALDKNKVLIEKLHTFENENLEDWNTFFNEFKFTL